MRLGFHRRPGLVVYVTCGDPSLAVTRDVVLDAIDAGADVIELGVPFSDPVADGPVIQRASERALVNGTTLGDVLKLAGAGVELRGVSLESMDDLARQIRAGERAIGSTVFFPTSITNVPSRRRRSNRFSAAGMSFTFSPQ